MTIVRSKKNGSVPSMPNDADYPPNSHGVLGLFAGSARQPRFRGVGRVQLGLWPLGRGGGFCYFW